MLETTFKALADENRLRSINILFHGEFCVCELEVLLGLSQSNLSRHLGKLKAAELITAKKDGQWVHYTISKAFQTENPLLFDYLQLKMSEDQTFKNDLERLNNYRKNDLTCTVITNNKEHVIQVINKEETNMSYRIAFICVHNSCRSQMAEGWAKKLGGDLFEPYSAGTQEYPEVKPLAVQVMEEAGVDMSAHKPKLIKEIPNKLDILITMGCNVTCPYIPNQHSEDWGIEDPSGKGIEAFRKTREEIREKVEDLINRIKTGSLDNLQDKPFFNTSKM